jgi:hypothetical protein
VLQSKGKEAALMMGDQPSPVSHLSDKSAWRADSRLSVCFTRNNRVTPCSEKGKLTDEGFFRRKKASSFSHQM